MDPKDPKHKLTPRPGARIPPTPSSDQSLAAEIERMAKAETNTLAILAHASRATAEGQEIIITLLQDIRDLLVKTCQNTGMPLPAHLQAAIDAGEYNPDAPDEDDDDDDDDEGDEDGDGDVLATTRT